MYPLMGSIAMEVVAESDSSLKPIVAIRELFEVSITEMVPGDER
jgi:hypothetical protein